ncbi:MAG: hypothetical protein WAQ25_04185 [Candidatus Saccharimonas sp.]
MSKERSNSFQRLFIINAVFYIPHHALLYSALKLRFGLLVKLLDALAERLFIKNSLPLPPDEKLLSQYQNTVSQARFWHGSGRFQHTGAKHADVLSSVIESGGFTPVYDAYGIFSDGETMVSTSFTTSRMVGRAYADIHGLGYKETERYGDALMWVAYYYGLFYARMYTFGIKMMKKHYKTWHELTHDENGHNTWGKKTNQHAEDVWDVFCLGSDIENNYPILYGVKDIHAQVSLAKIFRDYEVRSSDVVSLSEITHIEVPASRIDETKKLLKSKDIDIPVFNIELGEQFASRQAFHTLLGWSLKQK